MLVVVPVKLLMLTSAGRLSTSLPSLFLLLGDVGSLLKKVLNLLNCYYIKLTKAL